MGIEAVRGVEAKFSVPLRSKPPRHRVLHERAHDGPSKSRPGVRIARGLTLVSHRLELWGQADVVEFYRNGTILPVE